LPINVERVGKFRVLNKQSMEEKVYQQSIHVKEVKREALKGKVV